MTIAKATDAQEVLDNLLITLVDIEAAVSAESQTESVVSKCSSLLPSVLNAFLDLNGPAWRCVDSESPPNHRSDELCLSELSSTTHSRSKKLFSVSASCCSEHTRGSRVRPEVIEAYVRRGLGTVPRM